MDLIHNSTFRLLRELEPSTNYVPGIYRVILDEPFKDITVAALLHEEVETDAEGNALKQARRKKGGRPALKKSLHHRKQKPRSLIGDLQWLDKNELLRLEAAQVLKPIELEREGLLYSLKLSKKSQSDYERRMLAMAGFLDYARLEEGIILHDGLGGLVKDAMASADVSRTFVYKQFSLLCRFGFDELSLKPRRDRCGAPGGVRRCDPGGRKKAGRKTVKQRVAMAFGPCPAPDQPGMSTEWAAAILAADKQIKTPKPAWPKRCDQIISSQFVSRGKEENGQFVLIKPEKGDYPNNRQIIRVLTVEKDKLLRRLESTTAHHFKSALRGLVGRNWQGVAGPGHTWAIDSTVGDIYLRSSVNRAWIVGRPIVYVIVDIWSTAIVGFYVGLTGPSWNTAKISLFNAAIDPAVLGEMWGYQPVLSLNPCPTLPYCLMCDRGEFLSQGHRETAIKLLMLTSYAPPYRGDLKGLVEVIHRIEKDAQFLFIPGAMDYRRQEMEMRRVDPNDCIMTVREYVAYLHELFSLYNLTADRRGRLDAHLGAIGVDPSPSGLWHAGFQAGIGFRRATAEADLVTTLLPSSTAFVGRSSVRFARCDYTSDDVKAAQWTALSRNFGGWSLPVNHYPGSLSRIWTPNVGGAGLMRLNLSDESKVSGDVTFDDYMDALAFEAMRQPDLDHARTMKRVGFHDWAKRLIESSRQKTAEAISKASGKAPSMTEARVMETASTQPGQSEEATKETAREAALSEHDAMMKALLGAHEDLGDADA